MEASTVLRLNGLTKRFGSVLANDDITIELQKGEVLALLGENGAGKTTLMNMLFGHYLPDSGNIEIMSTNNDLVPLELGNPSAALAVGIGMVHQHFTLAENITALENITLGAEPLFSFKRNQKIARKKIGKIMSNSGLDAPLDTLVGGLSVGEKQRVEILKALYRDAHILVLDEPTAVLTPQETDELFNVIRTLVNEGKTVIFITHKLREVMEIADRVTVMRAGEVQGVSETKNTSITELASQMVGREVFLQVKKDEAKPKDEILSVENLWVHDARGLLAVNGVEMNIREGEIVGIAGVEGNGQTELVEALTGLRKATKGKIMYLGEDIASSSPKNIRRKKIAHIPEDRTNTGLNPQLSIWENLIGNSYFRKPLSSKGIFNLKKVAKHANKLKEDFDIRSPNVSLKVKSLSGGNQQKVVVARELSEDPTLTIASQPTRGVDIGNIEAIHEQLVQMRDEGGAVLLVSAELDEVMAVADRVAVMYEGQIVKWVNPKEVDQAQMGLYMAGVTE